MQYYHLKFVNLLNKRFIKVRIFNLKNAHVCSIFSYYSLSLLFFAFNLYSFHTNLFVCFFITGIQISPLLLFRKGLHTSHPRSLIWLCFLSLVYFTQGVMNALSVVHSLFGWGVIILSVLLFTSLTVSIRSNSKRTRKAG